jgi:hypothetical protein
MDDFRKIQRKECKDGSRNQGGGCYGCACCRKSGNLNKFKKYVRRTARKTLKNQDLRED